MDADKIYLSYFLSRCYDNTRHLIKEFNVGFWFQRVKVCGHLDRQHGSRQADMTLEQKLRVSILRHNPEIVRVNSKWWESFKISKPTPNDTPHPTRSYLLMVHKQFCQEGTHKQIYELMVTILNQNIIVSNCLMLLRSCLPLCSGLISQNKSFFL